eukprot:scaffold1026_cov409-Prasinococcus_capsulatus_cf.AAC.4
MARPPEPRSSMLALRLGQHSAPSARTSTDHCRQDHHTGPASVPDLPIAPRRTAPHRIASHRIASHRLRHQQAAIDPFPVGALLPPGDRHVGR